MFFLSLQKQKISPNQKKKINKTKHTQRPQNETNTTKAKWSLFYVGQLILGMRAALEFGWYTKATALEKTGFPLCQQVPIAHSFWFEGVTFVSSSPFSTGTLPGVNLYRSYECCLRPVHVWEALFSSTHAFLLTLPVLPLLPRASRGGLWWRHPI